MIKNTTYYIYHKPYKMMSQFSSIEGNLTLADSGFPERDIYPVGRLDYESEGLLILTNDNYLIHQLTSHTNIHKRTYLVQVDGMIDEYVVNALQNGIEINLNGKLYKTKPCSARIITSPPNILERQPPVRYRADIPTSWIELTLQEGKNRQVRRMTAKAGYPTLRLIRISIEDLELGNLKSGEFISMSKSMIYQKLKI